MNQIIHKPLLNTWLTATQQNLASTSFAFDWTRSINDMPDWTRNASNTLKIKGDFGDGNQFTGTDKNDIVTIGGKLIGGDGDPTSINFLNGDDTLTVGGKLIVNDGQYVAITGGNGNKTINLNSGIDFYSTPSKYYENIALNISLEGSGIKTINILGDVILKNENTLSSTMNYTTLMVFNLWDNSINYLGQNIININGSLISSGYTNVQFKLRGLENSLTIQNDMTINGGFVGITTDGPDTAIKINGNLTTRFASLVLDLKGNNNSELLFDVAGRTQMDSSHFSLMSDKETHSTFKFDDISLTGNNMEIKVTNGISSNLVINGDLDNSNGHFYFHLWTKEVSNIEIDGKIFVQRENPYGSQNLYSAITTDDGDDCFTLLGGIFNDGTELKISSGHGNDDIYIEQDISVCSKFNYFAQNMFDLDYGDDTFTLVGNMTATGRGENRIYGGEGNDQITIKGDVSVFNYGHNYIFGNEGDDIITLNGHIDADALNIDFGAGNDTLVLTALTQKAFETNYKDWLISLNIPGTPIKDDLETIRLDVRNLHIDELDWFKDIINKANANGAHITVEDRAGHQLINPTTYLAQNNDAHNPINDVLDHYAPTAVNAAQPKAFAENAANSSGDAFTAPHFDNNSFLHEMEQQAQAHAAAAA